MSGNGRSSFIDPGVCVGGQHPGVGAGPWRGRMASPWDPSMGAGSRPEFRVSKWVQDPGVGAAPWRGCRVSAWAQGLGVGAAPRQLPALPTTSRGLGARAPPPSPRRGRSRRGAWRRSRRPAVGRDAEPGVAGCGWGVAGRGGAGTYVEGDESQDAAQREALEIQPSVDGFHLPVLLRQPHQPAGTRRHPSVVVSPHPKSHPPRPSPKLGVPLDGGAAPGCLIAAVEAEGSPPAVHQQLVAVGVVTDDPGEDTDGHVLRVAGTQEGLLKVWEKRGTSSGWGACHPGGVTSRVGAGSGVPPDPLTVEEVVAWMELGELGHLRHRVAAGRRGADAGLGTRHPCPPQPAGTRGPSERPGNGRGGDTTPQAPWGTKPEVGPSPLGATGVGPEVGPSPVGAMGSRTGGGSITRGCHRRGIGGGDDSGSPRCARKHSPQMFKEAIQLWQSPPRPASVC